MDSWNRQQVQKDGTRASTDASLFVDLVDTSIHVGKGPKYWSCNQPFRDVLVSIKKYVCSLVFRYKKS